MIKFLLKAVANPHGAIAQAILKLVAKQFAGITKYVEEDNELDISVRKIEENHESLKNLVLELAKDFHKHEDKHAKV